MEGQDRPCRPLEVELCALAALNTWLLIYGRDDKGWALVENMTKNMNIILKSSLVFQQVGARRIPARRDL